MARTNEPTPVVVSSPWGDPDGKGPPVADSRHAHDRFYVHGLSDKRQDFELESVAGNRPAPLQFRGQYVSVERSNGQPFNDKIADYKTRGYVIATKDTIASYGIDPDKSGFIFDVDGTCRVGSQVLMIAPREVAARDYQKQMADNASLQGSPQAMAHQAAETFNREHGLSQSGGTAFEFDERTDGKPFEFEKRLFKNKS